MPKHYVRKTINLICECGKDSGRRTQCLECRIEDGIESRNARKTKGRQTKRRKRTITPKPRCAWTKCRRLSITKNLCRLHYNRVRYAINREEHKVRVDNWRRNYPEKVLEYKLKREAAIKIQTPPWADLNAINSFIEKCPPGMEVDHIIPIQGVNVRGLHVLHNLAYSTSEENSRKENKLLGRYVRGIPKGLRHLADKVLRGPYRKKPKSI